MGFLTLDVLQCYGFAQTCRRTATRLGNMHASLAFFSCYAIKCSGFCVAEPFMSVHSPTFPPEIIDQLVRNTMPLGYIYWDIQGNGLGCSPSVAELFGLNTPQEVFANWDRLSPLFQPNGYLSKIYFDELMALADVSGKIVSEWQHQTIHGVPFPVEITCVRHSFEGNDIIITYLRDQRESMHFHPESGIENFRFASILRSCPICFAILSGDQIAFATPYMHNFLGVNVGDSFCDIITDSAIAEMLCNESHDDDFVSWIPVTIRTQSGEHKEMLAYMLHFDETGCRSEKIVWLIDMTQSRRMEHELKTAKEIAEANTKAKSEFLANMSHEIRTPMNAIIGLTHLVLRTALTEQQTEYIETVQQSAHILLRLINDILDFSKIEAGRMVLEYREFSIESIITELSAVVDESIQKKNLELQIGVDGNLPPAVMGDSVRLHQVLLNLLTNAIKFTEQGTIRVNIEIVESDVLSVLVRFSVMDSGIGMSPLQIKGLFTPFSQASASTTRRFGGTGLGLAIAKQIVELMRGEIACQSMPGEGTTFVFTARFGIPLEGEIVNVDETTDIRTDALLVGDSPSNQMTLRHYIEILKAKVYQAGAELKDFKKILASDAIRDIDFVVFDFLDLRKDFVPIYTALRERRLEPMPVCVVVEHPDLDAVLSELGIEGSVHILAKPIVASDVFNVMAKTAARKEELQQKKKEANYQNTPRNGEHIDIPDSIRGAKILLVEDNKINQMVAKELLKVEGFETTVAENGRIALELLQMQKFDLILMDIQMPKMDGFEATRIIRSDERFKDLPILAMTASAMSGDRESSLEAGMNDHIAKPIDPKILYRALVRWIRK